MNLKFVNAMTSSESALELLDVARRAVNAKNASLNVLKNNKVLSKLD